MFNPAESSNNIKEQYIDYLSTTFSIADQDYYRMFRGRLNEPGIISKGPFIDIKDVFKSGRSIAELCDEKVNILSPLFNELECNKPLDKGYKRSLPLKRPLFIHQEKAINEITVKKNNTVITTGTSSGKTECFLIPIINELLREIEAGTLNPGVRALLIYPMNALANDQMKRLRNLLMYYPQIKFGVYNGHTQRHDDKAIADYKDLHMGEELEELKTPIENELISRDQMNETPPHILCTNYAMLEHLMLRPENDALFSNSDFKFVVLDEAHVYTGATGMETALLLRRLKARIKTSTKTQFILTSATLGEEGKSEEDIIAFAQNLCGESFGKSSIIYGTRKESINIETANNAPISMFEELAISQEDRFRLIFEKYQIPYDINKPYKENIFNLCSSNLFYSRLRKNVNGPIDIEDLQKVLQISKKQVVAFVHVCTLAEKNGVALIDAKYHFFVRALEGLYTTLIGPKQLFLERKTTAPMENKQIVCFERAVCRNCGELGIVGKLEKQGKLEILVHASQYEQDAQFFHIKQATESGFEAIDDEQNESDMDVLFDNTEEDKPKEKGYKEWYLCPVCGAISELDDGKPKCGCNCSPIVISEYFNTDGKCPKCQSGKYRRFYIGAEAATGVLATALFEELPNKTITTKNEDGIEFEFEGGKQFLAFSDSRSEAAFFASYLDKSYKEFLRRRGLVQLLEKKKEDILDEPFTVEELADELTKLFSKNKTFKENLTTTPSNKEIKAVSSKNAWIAILTELIYARRRTSLVSLGKIKFEYMGNNSKIIDAMSAKYKIDKRVCKELLDYLAMTIAYFGAISVDDDIIDVEERRYIFFSDKQKAITLQKTASTDRYFMSWKARNREGKENSFYPNSRVRTVARVLNATEQKANDFLEDYFYFLTGHIGAIQNKYPLEKGNGNFYFMPAQNYQIRIYGDENATWYKCSSCGKVSTINIDGICLENGCDGVLRDVLPTYLSENNHYLDLYERQDLKALLIKEHTAQLSKKEGFAYQTQFEKNQIHALSCSTTFEMGVDVGELETVFLRNVPPSAANYAQRAGRAGRSKNAAAYSLTYAKLSSHDFTYFNEPNKIIVGKIKPPVFKTDNKKIVLRHIYAVVLSYFFKLHPEMFDHNKSEAFLDKGGYEELVSLITTKNDEYDGLQQILAQSIPDVEQYNWQNELIGEDGILSCVVNEYKAIKEDLEKDINESYDQHDSQKAQSLERMLYKHKAKKLIDFFVRNNILPKYGFPIDTVELDTSIDTNKENELQLSRDLKMAISEYAPGEKVIANNRMYTSRYIKKSFFNNRMDYHTSYVFHCDDCGTWNYNAQDPCDMEGQIKCVACQTPIRKDRWNDAIEPRAGFIAEHQTEDVPMAKPDKIYKSQDSYIGDGSKIDEYLYSVNNRNIMLKSSENDSIMVTSLTSFYVCKKCGYTYGIHDIIKDEHGKKDKEVEKYRSHDAKIITVKQKHKNSHDHNCSNKTFYPYRLNHVYKTDVLVMDFKEYNADDKTMWSVMYALLNAMSDVLGVDQDDLGGCLKFNTDIHSHKQGYYLVLFDTVAGGAGHVRRLLNADILKKVIEKAHYAMQNCTNCDTSCYNCLRSYKNQRLHQYLNRHLAEDFLKGYLGDVVGFEQKTKENKNINIIVKFAYSIDSQEDFIDELEDVANDDIVGKVKIAYSQNDLPLPDYGTIQFEANNNFGNAYFCWKTKKVLLFEKNEQESYSLAKDSQYHCFMLDENFNIDMFVKALTKENE